MTALVIREWCNPKDPERLKRYYSNAKEFYPYLQEKLETGFFKDMKRWTDGTGYMVCIIEYENIEDFAKAWKDSEYNERWVRTARNCDNVKCRVLRPTIPVPPR